jgi:condensin complex subunit 1
MLKLIHSKEKSIKDSIIESFRNIYIPETLNSPKVCLEVAKEINILISSSNLYEISCIEIIISELIKEKHFPNPITLAFWEIYTNEEECQDSALILSMIANTQNDFFTLSNLKKMINIGFGEKGKGNHMISRNTCIILEKIKKNEIEKINENEINNLLEKLDDFINNDYFTIDNWIPFSERALNLIFLFSKNPEEISHNIIRKLFSKTKKVDDNDKESITVTTGNLTKFLFILGHSALKELINIEKNHQIEKFEKSKSIESKKSSIEEELGNDQLEEIDDKYENKKKELLSNEYIYGNYIKIVLSICNDLTNEFKNTIVRKVAILTLCKFMFTYRDICEQQIQLLFTLLKKCSSHIKGIF